MHDSERRVVGFATEKVRDDRWPVVTITLHVSDGTRRDGQITFNSHEAARRYGRLVVGAPIR